MACQAGADLDAVASAGSQGDRFPFGTVSVQDMDSRSSVLPMDKPFGNGKGVRNRRCLDEDIRSLTHSPVRWKSPGCDVDEELAGFAIGLAAKADHFTGDLIGAVGAEEQGGGLPRPEGGGGGLVDPGRDPEFVGGDDLEDGTSRKHDAARVTVASGDKSVERTDHPGEGESLAMVGEGGAGDADLLPGFLGCGICPTDIGFGDAHLFRGLVEFRLGAHPFCDEILDAFEICAGLILDCAGPAFIHGDPLGGGLSCGKGGSGEIDLLLEFAIVQPGEQLTRVDRVPLIHEHFGKAFLDACADGGLDARFECPGAGHLLGQ